MNATGLEPKPTPPVFVYGLSGSGFQSSCSHLSFGFCACLE